MTETEEVVTKPDNTTAKQSRSNGYYGLLIAVFNALFGLFLVTYDRRRDTSLERVTPLDLTMLGLSTFRLSKLVSEDEITAVFREPLVEEVDGERRPQGRGLRWALGKLVLCPTCTGTWVAAFLSYALHLSPRHTRPFLAMTSASGISQFGDAVISLVYTDRNVLRTKENSEQSQR